MFFNTNERNQEGLVDVCDVMITYLPPLLLHFEQPSKRFYQLIGTITIPIDAQPLLVPIEVQS